MTAVIFDIAHGSYVDGPGVRTTVFFKGCNLRCGWCHNPESQSREKELLLYKNNCTHCGICEEVCPNRLKTCTRCGACAEYCASGARQLCGQEYPIEKLFEIVEADRVFYETSGGGVTFSGGECMLQTDALKALAERCHDAGIHTAVDTAGDVPWEYFERLLPCTDLFLYDVKCFTEELHVKGTHCSNRRILENLRRLSGSFRGKIIIRIPVIGGFNDSYAEMEKIAGYLRGIRHEKTELLPYHRLGEAKYAALGRMANDYYTPDETHMEEYRRLFRT